MVFQTYPSESPFRGLRCKFSQGTAGQTVLTKFNIFLFIHHRGTEFTEYYIFYSIGRPQRNRLRIPRGKCRLDKITIPSGISTVYI